MEEENLIIERRITAAIRIKSHRTTKIDRLFRYRHIVGLDRMRVTTPAPIGFRFRKETHRLIEVEVEDAGVVGVVHSEEEDRADQNLEGVMGTTVEIFHHRVAIGIAESQTLCHLITETRAQAGIAGPKTKRNITILHLLPNPSPAFHLMAN